MRWLALAVALFWATQATAQSTRVPRGTEVRLVTANDLSSRKALVGQRVQLRVAEDVRVNGQILIPRDTEATGEIERAREKGWFGQRGRLAINPLHLTVNGITIRLTGRVETTGKVADGAVVGVALLSPMFTGKSARVPAGTPIAAEVARDTELPGS